MSPASGEDEPHPLLSDRAGEILSAALRADGVRLQAWSRTRVHRRGSSLSVRFDVDVTGADAPTLDVVAHISSRPVPPGAAVLRVDDRDVHVWRVPHDPYLPGLPAATSTRRVRELLDLLGVDQGPVTLTMRAYRPTRRAVIQVQIGGPAGDTSLYLKVMGGRRPARVVERTELLAAMHRAVAPHLPVPEVIGVAADQGIVALTALPGETLRAAVVLGHPRPRPGDIVGLTRTLAGIDVPSGADPRGYADVTRHVRVLGEALPQLLPALEEAAAFAATAAGPGGTVHGDLHDGQILVADGGTSGLLDIDGAGQGLLAQDAGRLVAHLQAAAELERADRGAVLAYADELAAGYRDLDITRRDLAAGAAGAWIGLATSPYRARPPDWHDLVRQRVERALEWARSDG